MKLKLIGKPSLLLCVILLFISVIQCFPPGVHKIDLHDSGVFVISTYNDYDDDEEEMIQPQDIEHIAALTDDEEKYEPLHTFVAQFNKQIVRPAVKNEKGLNKLSESRFRVRTLKSKPSIKRRKHENSKTTSDDDEDNNDDDDEKDGYDYDQYQTTIDDDDLKDINDTIWEETPTTEQQTSTPEDLYDLDRSSEEYESTSTYFTEILSSPTILLSTSTQEIDDYYGKTTSTSYYSVKYKETTESQDETSEWLSVVETSSLSMKIYDNEISSTYTSIESTESTGETISSDNASSSTKNYTMTRTSESPTTESTYRTEVSSAAPHRESTATSAETEPHRYTKENTKTSDKETTTEASSVQENTKHAFTAKNVSVDLHRKTPIMMPLSTRRHLTKPIITVPTTEETEITEPMEYEKIMPEYGAEIEELKTDKFTYNFTNDEIEKSLKNIVKKTLNFKKPMNCSEFKGWKYGVQAIECAISDYKDAKNETVAKMALGRSWKIIRVWLILYVCVAVPCWCQNGWCCCCCRCKICFPVKIIRKEKKYFALNPPGTLVDPNKPSAQPMKYEPTVFEDDAYQEFESAIRNL